MTAKALHGILIPVELIPVELICGGDVMAKRIEGVTEKLLECAKEEFLANGYEILLCASLRKRPDIPKVSSTSVTPTKKACIVL